MFARRERRTDILETSSQAPHRDGCEGFIGMEIWAQGRAKALPGVSIFVSPKQRLDTEISGTG